MHTISKTIDLDATPEQVWIVLLTDTAAHAKWNPFITRMDGRLAVGEQINVRIAPPDRKAMTFHPTVTEFEPERKLSWLGRFLVPGLFDGAHSFSLEPLPGGRTRFTQAEQFRGVLVRVSGKLLSNTADGFVAMNEALRERLHSPT